MKRILPVIVTLIILSLLGLFIFQASWLKNTLEVTKTQLFNKVQEAGTNVALDLRKSLHTGGPTINLSRKGFKFGFDISKMTRPLLVADRFSQLDIYNKLVASFANVGLKEINFDFAIVNDNGDIEMQSKNFITSYEDTNNGRALCPIVSEYPNDLQDITHLENLIIVVPDYQKQVWTSLKWVITAAGVFMFIIISAFVVTVTTLLRQKKLSEMKSDFINNMTHEFKTPLATISLAVDAIRNEKVLGNKEKLNYFSSIIKEENKRMNKHVETILQAALMEKQELQLKLDKLHAHALIEKILENYELQLKDKQGKLELLLNAKNDLINADEVHFGNLISNLVDNAIKYSKENLIIRVTTHNTPKLLLISIEDNGIGMSKESVRRIFEKFYRAHTGNVHNVKGFGLGMSYVKTVIDAHKGNIRVDSVLGRGTTFILELPLGKKV